MFVKATVKEFEEMGDREKAFYLKEKEVHEKEQLKLTISEAVKSQVVTIKSELEAENAVKLEESKAEALAELEKQKDEYTKGLKDLGLTVSEMKKVKATAESVVNQTAENFKAAYEKYQADIKSAATYVNGGTTPAQFSFTKAAVTTGSYLNNNEAQMMDGVSEESVTRMSLEGRFNRVKLNPDNGEKAEWIEEDSAVIAEAAAAIAEGALYPESSYGLKKVTEELSKIGHTLSITKQAVRGFSVLFIQVKSFAWRTLRAKVNEQKVNGTGVATQDLLGVMTIGALNPFVLGVAEPFHQSYQFPTIKDLANAVASTIKEDFKQNTDYVMPNTVLINPIEYEKRFSAKDSQNRPLWDATARGVAGDGALIFVQETAIPEGELLVGDTGVTTEFYSDVIDVEIGTVNDQFTRDLITLKISEHLLLATPTNRYKGWKKVLDIDLALADIKIP